MIVLFSYYFDHGPYCNVFVAWKLKLLPRYYRSFLRCYPRGGGGNSYTGHGIHVPARVMGQFAVFCPGYGSCFVNFALVMGLLYVDLPQLWINVSNLWLLLDMMTKNFCEKEFCFKNDTKHSLFMILAENFALFMGSYFKILPWLWVLIFKMLPWLWVITLNSQWHIYTRSPIGVTPPPRCYPVGPSLTSARNQIQMAPARLNCWLLLNAVWELTVQTRRSHLNLIPSTSQASAAEKATKWNCNNDVINFNFSATNTVHHCPCFDLNFAVLLVPHPASLLYKCLWFKLMTWVPVLFLWIELLFAFVVILPKLRLVTIHTLFWDKFLNLVQLFELPVALHLFVFAWYEVDECGSI